jgi:hypothetical protein
VQSSIGHSDYVRRDTALAALIQPLAGEYGMHNDQPQGGSAARPCNAAERQHRGLYWCNCDVCLSLPVQCPSLTAFGYIMV